MKGRSRLWLILQAVLAAGLVSVVVILAHGALARVERASQDRARTLARTVVRAMKGVIRHGPDQEGRIYGILDEVSRDPEVASVGVVRPDGSQVVVRGDPLTSVGVVSSEERLTAEGPRLVIVTPFEIEEGCMAPGKCACGEGRCACEGGIPWSLPPGSYGLAIVIDARETASVRATIVAVASLAVAILAGLLVTAALLARSIRERERLAGEVALERERSRSLESLGLLAAGLAHEMRNPLGALRGYAQLEEEQAAGPESRERSAIMLRELDRVTERLEEFLGFARRRRPVAGPVDLGALAAEAVALLRPDAEAAGVVLAVKGPADPVTVSGDAAQIKELAINLVLNAIEACDRDGRVVVEVALAAEGPELVVKDTGRGIRSEDSPHLFEPYFTTKETGSGLGLAISRRIAEEHGARLTLENAQGGGARARLVFDGGGRLAG